MAGRSGQLLKRATSPVSAAVFASLAMFSSVPHLAWSQNDGDVGAGCDQPEAGCVVLAAVRIEGLTAYDPGELAPLYQDYLTREVSTADLVKIATAITDKYRADGYFLSRAVVPTQLRGGVARIQVYEGYIGEVELTGVGAPAVERYFAGLAGKRPLKLAELDRRLSLAADQPGIEVKSQLQPDLDDPAKHRLVATAGVKNGVLSAYVDNRGPKTAGPWQAYVRGAYNSAIRPGDQAALAVLTVPNDPSAFVYADLSYSLPLGQGPRLRAAVTVAKARDGADPRSAEIGSQSHSASLAYIHPIVRRRDLSVWGQVSANAREVEQDWNLGGGYRDRVAALRGSISLDAAKADRSTNLFAQASVGRRGAPDGDRELSRFDADREFWKVYAQASHYRDLGAWAGLYVAAEGQWSPQSLLASEEFALGGAPFGRGYNYAEISGDRGVAGSAELRAGFDPKAAPLTFVQGYGFVDAGKVWNLGPRKDSAALASAGVGVRLRFGDRATLGVEAARPLTRTPYDRQKKGWRPFAYLSTLF